ncbi:hypothetical protein SteCoe_8330 [Stentor coeruleus]|uniref:TPX2 C-terminal domain-containing protein n=1 Tax=Stentor coeruleus TaxID=5963 RepID=A0A1R2CKI0_9CILI|nr:hypothetical protein SteCoe_8330 [Stentor coeruleus]
MSANQNLKRKFIATSESTFNMTKKFKFSSAANCSQNPPMNFSFESSENSSALAFFNTQPRPIFTIPQPFNLITEQRVRKICTLPTEDLELQKMQNRPKFKAKPMPKFTPVPEPLKASCKTIPQEFNQPVKIRSRNTSVSAEESQMRFSARSCPESFKLEIQKPHFTTIVPQTPSLEAANRIRGNSPPISIPYKFEALPLPSFYETSQSRSRSIESANNENFKFFARPMPSFDKVFVPNMDFVPTQPVDFKLNTQKRAVEREKFENFVKDKENFIKEQQMELAKIEAEDVRQYRKSLEFRAKPLQEHKPFFIKRSEEKLTTPKSPLLHTKLRASLRDIENYTEEYMDID